MLDDDSLALLEEIRLCQNALSFDQFDVSEIEKLQRLEEDGFVIAVWQVTDKGLKVLNKK